MANSSSWMAKMGNPSCEWVHARLPLLMEARADCPGDFDELIGDDRPRIDLHLEGCPSCRQRLVELEGVLSILSNAAVDMEVMPPAPSLWPVLQQRIDAHHVRAMPGWRRAVRGLWPRGLRSGSDRLRRVWDRVCSELPLRWEWTRDSLNEALAGRSADVPGPSMRGALPSLCISLGVAALIALIVVPVAHHHRDRAETLIAANSAPIASMIGPPRILPDREQSSTDSDESPSNPPTPLAQADPVTPPEPAASRSATTNKPAAPAPRYDFVLEHGIPMPPDARGAKPAY